MEGDVIVLQDLFDRNEGGGALARCPFRPSFTGDLQAVGYRWPEQV
jgi:hypothetical protein